MAIEPGKGVVKGAFREVYGNIIIEVRKYNHKYLPIHQKLANGETPSGEKFEVAQVLADGSYLLLFPGKREERFLISMQEIVTKALDLRERKKACQTEYPFIGEDGAIPGIDTSIQTEFPEPERY